MGDSSSEVSFNSVGDSRTKKAKGVRNAGNQTLVVGRDPLDAGQIALRAAERTKFPYAIKLVLADAADANDTPTIMYYKALVMGAPNRIGSTDNVMRQTFTLGITSEIVEVPSAVVA